MEKSGLVHVLTYFFY